MDRRRLLGSVVLLGLPGWGVARAQRAGPALFPARGAKVVNPDTPLKLTFSAPPKVGRSGSVRVYDAADDRLVDTLDLSIPAGPTERFSGELPPYLGFPYPYARTKRATNRDTRAGTPSAGAAPALTAFQLTIIGGFIDGFHFYPVLVSGNTATIQLHHDLLDYCKTYYVQVDPGVIIAPGFTGITDKSWRFSTKARGPAANARHLVVSADGSGDFTTVQGALDFLPDGGKDRVVISVRPGVYQEIVYCRNKSNITLIGASAEQTIVRYANNEVFNPHPVNLGTNEMAGTFPSRRAAFTMDNATGIHIHDMTIETTSPGQAEGLLITGQQNVLVNVTINGAGDALQVNGSAYFLGCTLFGTGDTILGRGPCYFERCLLRSTRVFMWIRNTETGHGNVFNHCTFIGTAEPTELARSPFNRKAYPHAEAVFLNSTLAGISPEGFGGADDGGKVRFWEFNSRTSNGVPIDVSRRARPSRQLDKDRDAKIIADYSDPVFVLGGWNPRLELNS